MHLHQQIYVYSHMYMYLYKYIHTHIAGGYGLQSVVPSGGKKSAAALLVC